MQELPNDMLYRLQMQYQDVRNNSQGFDHFLTSLTIQSCPFLTATSTTDQSSVWGIGPLVDGTEGKSLFPFLRLPTETSHLRNISVKYLGYM
jgi:hypothetical protein